MESTKKSIRNPDGTLIRYDRVTILLHWVTFALVVLLFALAEIWGFLKHGTPIRGELQSLHISLGIVLTAVIVIRLVWRAVAGRHLSGAAERWTFLAEKSMHSVLYLLLMTQIVTGFLYRWAQAESFLFFGLFPVRFSTKVNVPLAYTFEDIHNFVAWTIIIMASFHSAAALLHHYMLKDDALRKMLPGIRGSR